MVATWTQPTQFAVPLGGAGTLCVEVTSALLVSFTGRYCGAAMLYVRLARGGMGTFVLAFAFFLRADGTGLWGLLS